MAELGPCTKESMGRWIPCWRTAVQAAPLPLHLLLVLLLLGVLLLLLALLLLWAGVCLCILHAKMASPPCCYPSNRLLHGWQPLLHSYSSVCVPYSLPSLPLCKQQS